MTAITWRRYPRTDISCAVQSDYHETALCGLRSPLGWYEPKPDGVRCKRCAEIVERRERDERRAD